MSVRAKIFAHISCPRVVLLVLGLLFLAAAPAQGAGMLWHVASRIAQSKPVSIIAFGSSSTSGIGASSPQATYPACLERALRARPDFRHSVIVTNRGVAGDDIDAMMRRLDGDILAVHPDLVIWQLGTNEILENMPVAHFEALARAGIAALRQAGIDVVLMEPQRAPQIDAVAASAAFRAAVRGLGVEFDIPVLRRFDLMARWAKSRDGNSLVGPDGLHMSDIGYLKLGQAAAELITSAAHPTLDGR